MGMYTEIYVNVDLKKETPQEIIDTLRQLCEGLRPSSFPTGSWLPTEKYVRSLTYDEIPQQWSFLGKGDLKNYSGEVEHFFSWLMPWVDGIPGDFVGYHRYEEDQKPTLVFIPEEALPND